MDAGLAVQPVIWTPLPDPFTTTVAVAFWVPLAPVAESWYVVVWVGDTLVDPWAATVPMPEIETVVAFTTFHDSCDAWPELMVGGFEVKKTIWMAVAWVVTLTLAEDDRPLSLVTVKRKT